MWGRLQLLCILLLAHTHREKERKPMTVSYWRSARSQRRINKEVNKMTVACVWSCVKLRTRNSPHSRR